MEGRKDKDSPKKGKMAELKEGMAGVVPDGQSIRSSA